MADFAAHKTDILVATSVVEVGVNVPNATQIIIEGIKHPGFSFIQILSPCVTFRPEQREWRNQVRPAPVPTTGDPSVAAKRIMTDDGFNLGILYAGDRPSYQMGLKDGSMPVSELGREFVL